MLDMVILALVSFVIGFAVAVLAMYILSMYTVAKIPDDNSETDLVFDGKKHVEGRKNEMS